MKKKKDSFTLVELMIVIMIIVILAGLLLPALKQARDAGKGAACTSQMKQIGTAIVLYINQNNNYLPPHAAADQVPNWKTLIAEELNLDLSRWHGANSIFSCPADVTGISASRLLYKSTHIGKSSYACNLHVMDSSYVDANGDGTIGPLHISQIQDTSGTIMIMDAHKSNNSIGWCNFDAGCTYKAGKSYGYPDRYEIGAIKGYHSSRKNNWLFCDISVRSMHFNKTMAPEKNLWKVKNKDNNDFGL